MGDYDHLELLHVDLVDRVAIATIDAPPINVMTRDLFVDLAKFGAQAGDDDAVRAVVLRSADPDFFIAHFDVALIMTFPHTGPAEPSSELNDFHRMCETYRTMPKPTIVEIDGRIGGGGNELAMSCDMRFGSVERAVFNQPEVALGLIPGGTGTQRLPHLVGRARALEIVLGAIDVDATTAADWGLLNRALPAAELRGHVDGLARRIAGLAPEVVALAKRSVLNAHDLAPLDGLLAEAHLFAQTLRFDDTRRRMQAFLDNGGQTRDGELNLTEVLAELDADRSRQS